MAAIYFDTQSGKNRTPSDLAPLPVVPLAFQRWQANWSKTLAAMWDPVEWDRIAAGSGQSYSQATSQGNLVSGTTINAETILRSRGSAAGTQQFKVWTQLSTRQVNQNFYLELVDVIGDGLAFTNLSATQVQVFIPGHTFTADNIGQSMSLGAITGVAGIPGYFPIAAVDSVSLTFTVVGWPGSGSGSCSLFGWNFARLNFDGAGSTTFKFSVGRDGWALNEVSISCNTTGSPGNMFKLCILENYALVFDKLTASSGGTAFTQRGSRDMRIPRLTSQLFFQARVVNGTSAPAGSATITLEGLSVETVDVVPTEAFPIQSNMIAQTVTPSGGGMTCWGSSPHSSAVGGNPVRTGGKGVTAIDTTIINGDACDLNMDSSGRLIVNPDGGIPELSWRYSSAGTPFSATADISIAAAAGASVRRRILIARVRNSSATAGYLIIKDGALEIDRIPLPANMTNAIEYNFGANARTTANTAMNIACSVASMSVDITIFGTNEI